MGTELNWKIGFCWENVKELGDKQATDPHALVEDYIGLFRLISNWYSFQEDPNQYKNKIKSMKLYLSPLKPFVQVTEVII